MGSPEHRHPRPLTRGRAQAKQHGDMQKYQRVMDWTRPVPPHAKTRLCPLSQAPSRIEGSECKDFSAQGGQVGCIALGQCQGTGHPGGQLCHPPSLPQPPLPACSLKILRVLQHWGWWPSLKAGQCPRAPSQPCSGTGPACSLTTSLSIPPCLCSGR